MKFSEIPYFLIQKYLEKTLSYESDGDGSYLIGPTTTIVTEGGKSLELWIKDPDVGFKPIIWVFPSTDYLEEDRFIFDKSLNTNVPSSLTTELSGGAYFFSIYDTDGKDLTTITASNECYLKKDSTFHEWIETNAPDYLEDSYGVEFVLRNYVNTDRQFIYFGDIYPTSNGKYHIIHYNMRSFVKNAIPEHQRTEKLKDLIDIHFDILHNEMYTKLKEIFSMIDPLEVEISYLNYLAKFYNVDIDNFLSNNWQKRVFIKNLINILKKKGTYSLLYIIWKIFTNNVIDRLNIYERWHDKSLTGTVPVSACEDYVHVWNYDKNLYDEGAGSVWYNTVVVSGGYPEDTTNKILTPHYTVEPDLTTVPTSDDTILSENLITNLYDFWEQSRPVNRVSHYSVLIAPKTDLSGDFISNYSGSYANQLLTKRVGYTFTLPDTFIGFFNTSSNSWLIKHNLNSKRIQIQCFDSDLFLLKPTNITVVDFNHVRIDFDNPDSGFVMIKEIDNEFIRFNTIPSTWNITHSMSTKELLVQFRDSTEIVVEPSEITLTDSDNLSVEGGISGFGEFDRYDVIHIQNTASSIWSVNHSLGYRGVMVNVYNHNDQKIYPQNIELEDANNCSLTFSEPTSGYAVLTTIGSPLFEENLRNSLVVISSEQNDLLTYEYSTTVDDILEDSEFTYIKAVFDEGIELSIKSFGVISPAGTVLFYSECTELFKKSEFKLNIFYKISKEFL